MRSLPDLRLNHFALALALLSAVVSGCGGGGGGSGGGGGGGPGAVQRYSVAANVVGLASGTTLSLQNNGADTVNVTADSGIAFPTRLAAGSAYNVTVSTQPAGQTCVVFNGAGTMG